MQNLALKRAKKLSEKTKDGQNPSSSMNDANNSRKEAVKNESRGSHTHLISTRRIHKARPMGKGESDLAGHAMK